MKKQIPNLITLLNLFFGCLAILVTFQSGTMATMDETGSMVIEIPEQIYYASMFIGLAAIVDFFDGFAARLLKVNSELGKQLDSLADVVSFGVAPGVILYQFLRISWMREQNGLDIPIVYLLPAFILSCAAAYRLAKFNIDTTQDYAFKGVPTPGIGLLIASFPLMLHYGGGLIDVNQWLINKWVLYSLIIILSWLMVCNLSILSLKFKDYTLKNNLPKVILFSIAVISIPILHWLAIPVIFIAYIILSLLFKNKSIT